MNKNILALTSCLFATTMAHATIFSYTVSLSGPNESPTNASPGIGSGTAAFDTTLHTLALNISFSGLTGTTTASHIHAATTAPFSGTAGVATTTPSFTGFPLGVTSGSFSNTLDLTLASSYNSAYISANGGTTASAEAALEADSAAGKAYWNIHTSTFGGGEIRGFLTPAAAPEPASLGLIGLGFGALALVRRRRR